MSDANDFSGMWRCVYWYPSNQNPGQEETSEYYCQAEQTADKVIFESLPNKPSHIVVNVTVEHSLVTGNWVEDTNPDGEFEGMQYSGAIQLLIDDEGQRMTGKWVGVGRERQADGSYVPHIYTGKFELTRAGSQAVAV